MTVDLVNFPGDWTAKGFLPADNKTRLQCSGFFGQRPCNRKGTIWPSCQNTATKECLLKFKVDFFENFGKRPPVHAPYETPLYSNIGLTLLGLVIETVTNQTYEDWIQHTIINPVKMNKTFMLTPADSFGFIPTNAIDWDVKLGVEAPYVAFYFHLQFVKLNVILAPGRYTLRHQISWLSAKQF